LFTSDNAIGVDVQTIFQQLTAPRRPVKLKKLLHSPFTLHRRMLELVDREAANAAAGKAARIMLKMNALTEVEVIKALYRASGKGVKIDLIIRGICALRPGIEGLSENIRVRSIIDRFLEHTRVFYFHNRGEPEVYLSSADWMDRNFFYRIETCFPVEDRRLRDRIIKECLHNYLSDNTAAWALRPDGSYHAVAPGIAKPRNAQQRLLQQLSD
jgi:polyphosphate kinase